jgi:hypothetical protein
VEVKKGILKMKKLKIVNILMLLVLSSNCLKAKRSPYDSSKPSPGLGAIIIGILSLRPAGNLSSPVPTVTSTSPADSATGITANTSVQITFSLAMDKASITTNSDDTTCSGSVQISFDNFATCVKMRSNITTTDNKTFTLSANPTMGTFATHKIKVTTNAKSDTSVKLASDYSHSTGFATSTPCTVFNAVTCPIPFSTAATMTASLGNGGLVIPIESGSAKGKILVLIGGNTATPSTSLFNPETGSFTVGPNLTGNYGSNEAGVAFSIGSGTNSGKILIAHGYLSNTSSIYDPLLNTMQAGPNLTDGAVNWIHAFPISSGVNVGKTLVVSNAAATTNIYDPSTNLFSVGPSMLPATPSPNSSSHNITISSGANSGKTLVVYAGGSGNISVYDPTVNSFSSGASLTPVPWYGSNSFVIPSGAQSGNILIARGNASTNTFIFNTSNLTVSAGPTLPSLIDNGADSGTHNIAISSGVNQGKIWLIHATANPPSTSSFYDPSTNSFSSGPAMITRARFNSKTVYIDSGIYSGKYMTFYGGASYTSLYDPIKNAIDPSSILPSSAGNGIHRVLLTTGSNAGKMLVINGGNNASSLFDFASGTFSPGPNLTGVMGRSPGVFTISGGSQDGKIFVVHGGGIATTSLYDPVANSFSTGPALSAAANNITSECIFKVPSGAQAGKYLIVHANVSTSTSLYDPSNNTISAGTVTGATIGIGATCFPITSGTHSGKFLLVQGFAATGTRMYDPATNTFGAGPVLTMNTTNGTFSMPITNGANNGKSLIIIGSGTTTNLYDPTTHTFSVGPNLSASATGGAYLLLTVGSNKDKYLIMHGTASSIYDSGTNTIISGPALPDGGSLAFNITSGLFNQGVLLVTGSGNLTSVLYP